MKSRLGKSETSTYTQRDCKSPPLTPRLSPQRWSIQEGLRKRVRSRVDVPSVLGPPDTHGRVGAGPRTRNECSCQGSSAHGPRLSVVPPRPSRTVLFCTDRPPTPVRLGRPGPRATITPDTPPEVGDSLTAPARRGTVCATPGPDPSRPHPPLPGHVPRRTVGRQNRGQVNMTHSCRDTTGRPGGIFCYYRP